MLLYLSLFWLLLLLFLWLMLMSGAELLSLKTPLSSHQRSWLEREEWRRGRRRRYCVCIAGKSRHYTNLSPLV